MRLFFSKKLVTMKDLYFMNPVFTKKTLNLTVRRGDKWKDYQGEVKILDTDSNDQVANGKVIYAEHLAFEELSDRDLALEHDPGCRTTDGLYHELQRVYPGFEEKENVTLVYFKVT